MNYIAHPTAIIDKGCEIGDGSEIGPYTHILTNTKLGRNCKIAQNVVVGPDVILGNNVIIDSNVLVCSGVTADDDVFIGANIGLTNVKNPRSAINRHAAYLKIHFGKGATVFGNAAIVCGHNVGEYAVIAPRAVVTKNIPPYAYITGNPGKISGWRSELGHELKFDSAGIASCPEDNSKYKFENNTVIKIS